MLCSDHTLVFARFGAEHHTCWAGSWQDVLSVVDERRSCAAEVNNLLALGAVFYLVDTPHTGVPTVLSLKETNLTYLRKLIPLC